MERLVTLVSDGVAIVAPPVPFAIGLLLALRSGSPALILAHAVLLVLSAAFGLALHLDVAERRGA